MFSEDNLQPIAALQHLAFCERQWGLMYLEQIWAENRLTVEGKQMHERADENSTEVRGGVRIARGLRLRSLRLGLTGRADIVEFHPSENPCPEGLDPLRSAIPLENVDGLWKPFPVEYKHGKPKLNHCDEIQLCAQALCLEEMLSVTISAGAVFYGRPHRRFEVAFNNELRTETEKLTKRLHKLTNEGKIPHGKYEKKCRSCSLLEFCMPKVTVQHKSVARYLNKILLDNSCKKEME